MQSTTLKKAAALTGAIALAAATPTRADGYQFIGDGKSAFKDNGYEDDTARQNWGGEWQTPSDAQLKWLIDNCTWAWDNINAGYTLTSKVSGYTSKSIFLPAAGTMSIPVTTESI